MTPANQDNSLCATNSEKIRQLEIRTDKIDVVLERVKNRLPHWATLVISLLTLTIGWLLSGGGKT